MSYVREKTKVYEWDDENDVNLGLVCDTIDYVNEQSPAAQKTDRHYVALQLAKKWSKVKNLLKERGYNSNANRPGQNWGTLNKGVLK